MRRAMIAAALVLLPLSAHAQSRPAPDTPGPPDATEDSLPPQTPRRNNDALRVLVVTSGIIGGFIAADIASGGVLTAPLLASGTLSAAELGGTRLFARAVPIRPVIAKTSDSTAIVGAGKPLAAALAGLSRFAGRAATVAKPVP